MGTDRSPRRGTFDSATIFRSRISNRTTTTGWPEVRRPDQVQEFWPWHRASPGFNPMFRLETLERREALSGGLMPAYYDDTAPPSSPPPVTHGGGGGAGGGGGHISGAVDTPQRKA